MTKEPKIREYSRIPIWFSRFTPIKIDAVTLAPFGIFARGILSARMRRHEEIHWRQQFELGLIRFYFTYIWEYIRIRWRSKLSPEDAYRSIAFEAEAYDNQDDPDYLITRTDHAWKLYIFTLFTGVNNAEHK